MPTPTVFISYSHKDQAEKETLLTHLKGLQQAGRLTVWSDDQISAGERWADRFAEAIAQADVALLLITANYLASDFIVREEAPRLLARQAEEGLRIIPIIARPCAWPAIDWLQTLEVYPKHRQPIWRDGGQYAERELAALVAGLVGAETALSPDGGESETLPQKIKEWLTGDSEAQRQLRTFQHRTELVEKVEKFWVENVLNSSLHDDLLLDLAMDQKQEAGSDLWAEVIQPPRQPSLRLPSGTDIGTLFDEAGGSLLILGAPGAGKTTILLELARRLIERTRADPLQPAPVVFNLSSWADKRLALADWLIEELNIRYGISLELGRRWLQEEALTLLLDGLDEVAPPYRDACVAAINDFRRESMAGLAVCSRRLEYEALTTPLHLQDTVELQTLTLEQIDRYLERLGPELAPLQASIHRYDQLQQLANSPLLLNLMVTVYRADSDQTLPLSASLEETREQLLAAYVTKMFERRGASKLFSKDQTIHWLSFLAKTMQAHGQTDFFLEKMQASWLPTEQQQRWYKLSLSLIGSVAFFVVGTLSAFLAVGWIMLMRPTNQPLPVGPILGVGVAAGLAFMMSSFLAAKRWVIPVIALITGLFLIPMGLDQPLVFLFAGIIFGLPGAIGGAPFARSQIVQVSDSLRWNWLRVGGGMIIGVIIGLLVAFLVNEDKLISALEVGVPTSLIFALLLGLSRVEAIETREKPNEGLYRSGQTGLRIGLGMTLVTFLAGLLISFLDQLVIGVAFSLLMAGLVGLATGLYFGGHVALQQGLLRYLLHRHNFLPWQLINFLDYAQKRIFLRKIGPGYRFIHQWLQDHFAQANKKQY